MNYHMSFTEKELRVLRGALILSQGRVAHEVGVGQGNVDSAWQKVERALGLAGGMDVPLDSRDSRAGYG